VPLRNPVDPCARAIIPEKPREDRIGRGQIVERNREEMEFGERGINAADAEQSRPQRDPRLERQTWEALQGCVQLAQGALRARLRPETGLSPPRFAALALLFETPEGLGMSRLSRELRVTNANGTALVNRLEKEGWVARHSTSKDRRRVVVRLTESARRAFAAMHGPYESMLAELFAGLSLLELRLLAGLLDRLGQHLQQDQASRSRATPGLPGRRFRSATPSSGPGWGWV
jgi:DNA-binding MarR family transcriptional regulator